MIALIETLRGLYSQNKISEFLRVYNLGGWMLKPDERAKIDAFLISKGIKRAPDNPGTQESLLNVEDIMRIIPGTKIVE